MNEMNGISRDLIVDAMIDKVVQEHAASGAGPSTDRAQSAPEGVLVAALSRLSTVEWPADEAGERITRSVSASAQRDRATRTRPRRSAGTSRWLIAGAVAAAALLVAGTVQLIGASHRPGRPVAGKHTATPRATSVPASTGGTPSSVTAMTIVSQAGTLKAVGALSSNNDFLYCATRSVCYLQGHLSPKHADIVRSEDGGATWTSGAALPTLPVNTPWDAVLSCPSALTCFSGYGSGMIETTDGFAHFRFQPVASPGDLVDQVSCSTTQNCVAQVIPRRGSQMFLYSDDGGTSWAAASSPPVTRDDIGGPLQCDRNGSCIQLLLGGQESAAMVGAMSSTDGGRTWSVPSRFYSIGDQEEWRFSCGDARNCVVTGNNGNLAWVHVTPRGRIAIRVQAYPKSWPQGGDAVSCATGRDCFIETTKLVGGTDYTDNLIEVTHDRGLTWASPIKTPTVSVYLSCPVRAGCIADSPENDSTIAVLSNLGKAR